MCDLTTADNSVVGSVRDREREGENKVVTEKPSAGDMGVCYSSLHHLPSQTPKLARR